MRKFLSVILIVIGVILLFMPFISKKILKTNSTVNISNITSEQMEKNKKNMNKSYDQDKVTPITPGDILSNSNSADKSKIIGQLTIPSINKEIVIFDGLDNKNLLNGACTMKPNQIMGLGNYCIAGHYCDNKDVLFGGLIDVKKGDIVRITNKKNIYEYKVFDTMIVKDDRVDLLSDGIVNHGDGRALLSLMTCYKNQPGYRYFVVAKFQKLYPYSKERMLEGFTNNQ